MPCFGPLQGWRHKETGGLTFKASEGDGGLSVPCGQCMGCLVDKRRAWKVRGACEAQMHPYSSFLTLTYSDDYLPYPPQVEVRVLQLFFKRLRKILSERVGYLACGEYGERDRRPHYHVCLFGHDFAEDRYPWSQSKSGYTQYRSPSLEKIWPFGHSTISDFDPTTAEYTAGYITKSNKPKLDWLDVQTGETGHLHKEFLLASRKPALGLSWLLKYRQEVLDNDFVVLNGTRHRVPPYFWQKLQLWAEDEGDYEAVDRIKARRLENLQRLVSAGELEARRQMTKQESANLKAKAYERSVS